MWLRHFGRPAPRSNPVSTRFPKKALKRESDLSGSGLRIWVIHNERYQTEPVSEADCCVGRPPRSWADVLAGSTVLAGCKTHRSLLPAAFADAATGREPQRQ